MSPEAPLAGYRVVDFTSVVAGPWCTRLLADCGAQVIKIESPGAGDVLRYSPPIADGASRVYAHFNAGKQNVCIDLKSPDGVRVARRLIDQADVVVENFRPGVMQRLGLDYDAVKGRRTDLIYCSVSGFGQTGALATAPAYAPVIHALSGYDHAQQVAQREDTGPLSCGIMVADILSATYAFAAIQTAVIQRERFGIGAFLDVSLMDCMLSMVAIQTQEAQWPEEIRSNVFHPVAGADGHVIIPLVNLKNFKEMFAAIESEALLHDPRYQTLQGIMADKDAVLGVLAVWAGSRPVAEIVAHMQQAGLPCARYRAPAETLRDDHLCQRGAFVPMMDAVGPFVAVNNPFRGAGIECQAQGWVATSGEHTDEVLASAGFAAAEIDALRKAEAIR